MNHYSHTRFSPPDLDLCDDLALSHTHNIFDVSVPFARSRSHSRQPDPTRSTTRRNNSLSRPQAIVIPNPQHRIAASVGAAPHNWFFPSHSSPSDFSLPTPDFSHDFFPFALPPKDLPLSHSIIPASHPHPATTTTTTTTQSAADKQAAIASEKRRRRRESHNAVERRRRDNINEKISELATLIPECMLDIGSSPHLDDPILSPISPVDVVPGLKKEDDVPAAPVSEGGVVKANKGMILRKSVEYIRYLQQLVTAQGVRNRELEHQLKTYRGTSVSPEPLNATVTTTTTTTTDDSIFRLPTTKEDDEFDQGQRGASEDSLSGSSWLQEQQAERGRTRSVRRPGTLTDVAMET